MINFAKLAINRPVSICMIALALVVFGVSAIFTAPVELMPEIEVPMIVIATVYPGAGPEDVESLVTKPIEEAIATQSGVKHIESISSENMSLIVLEMNYGVNMDVTHMDLQEKINMNVNNLPDDANKPMIIEININDMMDTMSLSATTTADLDLLYYVEDKIVPEFEKLSGVASVDVSGGQKNYVSVELNQELLKQYNLNMSTIIGFVSSADFSLPIGSTQRADQNLSLQGSVRYSSINSLKNVPITLPTGDVIRLSDVANIYEATEEATSVSRYNGDQNINIGIKKRQSSSTIGVCNDIAKVVDELNKKDSGVNLKIVNNSADQVMDSISTVVSTLAIAIVLAMVVLFVFLGDIKASVIIGVSIPVSLLTTLILMNALGFSFNIVSLSALIIAIGNMVDNSVVVIDSCFAVQNKVKTAKEAAIEGTRVVTTSQIAGSLAAMVTFLPMALMSGMAGQMFKQLGLTIVFASAASVMSALTVVPLLFYWLKPQEKKDILMSRLLKKTQKSYSSFLQKTFNHKVLVIIVAVVMLVGSIGLALTLNYELMAATDEGIINITVDLKPGLKLEAINEALLPIEKMVAEHPDVDHYSLRGGGSGSAVSMMEGASSGSASVTAYLKSNRSIKTIDLVEQWKKDTAGWPGYNISISSYSQTEMISAGIEVNLEGTNREALEEASFMVEALLHQNPDISHIASSATATNPRAEVVVDPVKAASVGLTPLQVISTIYSTAGGNKAATITAGSRDYDVRVEFPRDHYRDVTDIAAMSISSPFGEIPLMDIAAIEYTTNPQSIHRLDSQYRITVSGQPTLATRLTAQATVNEQVLTLDLPAGVSIAAASSDEMMREEFTSIINAILTALLLMFMVLAMQFESTRFSLVVMISIPFSMIGAFMLMRMFDITFSMTSLIGFLLLFTTVINNSILYIDTVAMLQNEEGMEVREALVTAGISRTRPILMTTCVTLISIIPEGLGIGSAGEIMQGMAVVIIGGLIAATILTLLLLPTFYLMLEEGKQKRQARRLKRQLKNSEPETAVQ